MSLQDEEIFDNLISGSESEPEGEYEVEKIKDDRWDSKTGRKYLVSWIGYPGQDTWEPEENLTHCPEKLVEYKASKKKRLNRQDSDDDDFIEDNSTAAAAGQSRSRSRSLSTTAKQPVKRKHEKQKFVNPKRELTEESDSDENSAKRTKVNKKKEKPKPNAKKAKEEIDLKRKEALEKLKEQRKRRNLAKDDEGEGSKQKDSIKSKSAATIRTNERKKAFRSSKTSKSEEGTSKAMGRVLISSSSESTASSEGIANRKRKPIKIEEKIEEEDTVQANPLEEPTLADEPQLEQSPMGMPEEREEQTVHDIDIPSPASPEPTEQAMDEDFQLDGFEVEEEQAPNEDEQQQAIELDSFRISPASDQGEKPVEADKQFEEEPQSQKTVPETLLNFIPKMDTQKDQPEKSMDHEAKGPEEDTAQEMDDEGEELEEVQPDLDDAASDKSLRKRARSTRTQESSSSTSSSSKSKANKAKKNIESIDFTEDGWWNDLDDFMKNCKFEKEEEDPLTYEPMEPYLKGQIAGTVRIFREGQKNGFERGWEVESVIGLAPEGMCYVKFVGIQTPQKLPLQLVKERAMEEYLCYCNWVYRKRIPTKRNDWEIDLKKPESWMSDRAIMALELWREERFTEKFGRL